MKNLRVKMDNKLLYRFKNSRVKKTNKDLFRRSRNHLSKFNNREVNSQFRIRVNYLNRNLLK